MSWTLHLGDCLDPVTGLASLPDKSVDHVICDPPYEAEAHTMQRRTKSDYIGRTAAGDKRGLRPVVRPISFPPITPDERAATARELARVVRRWVLVFCQAEAVSAWRDCLVAAGLTYKRACVWVKPDGQPQLTGDRPGMGYESIVVAHTPGKSTWNGGGRLGVFSYYRQEGNDSQDGVGHPTKKPEALMDELARLFTDPGDLILDPFAGSGTTGVAAIRLGRRFIGWEKDPKYHAAATKRLAGTREQLSLLAPRARKPKQESLL